MHIPADAVIPTDKLTRYLLQPRPYDDKSRYLAQGGFTQEHPEALRAAIQRLSETYEAVVDTRNEYGEFYRVLSPSNPGREDGLMLEQYQRVAFHRDLPEHGLRTGDIATLVDFVPHPTGGERGCVLEVFNAVGDSLTVLVVPESAVEPLTPNELLTVRPMTEAIT